MQILCATLYCYLWPVYFYNIFSHHLINGKTFWGGEFSELKTCVLIFSTMFCETLGFCDRASWANCEVREKTNKMQESVVYYQHCLNMFRASLCPKHVETVLIINIWLLHLVGFLSHFKFCETFLTLRRTGRHIKLYIGLHGRYPLFLSDFNETRTFSIDFEKH